MAAGTRIPRTIVASSRTAKASPTPSSSSQHPATAFLCLALQQAILGGQGGGPPGRLPGGLT